MRTTFYDLTDPFRIEETKRELTEVRKAVEAGRLIETPISAAVDLKELRSSGDAMQRAVAELAESVADLRAEVRQLGRGVFTTVSPPVFSSAGTALTSASNYAAHSHGTSHVIGVTPMTYEPGTFVTNAPYWFEPFVVEQPEESPAEDDEQGPGAGDE
jgi:hypothetical protein